MDDLLGLVVANAEREEAELPLVAVNLNRVLLGNPGTGARLSFLLFFDSLSRIMYRRQPLNR